MKITVLAIGRTQSEYLAKGISNYLDRIARYMPVELKILPDLKSTRALSEEQQKDKEGRLILDSVTPADHVTLLDERGKQYTSREFAALIDKRASSGLKRLVLVIGGPYGFSPQVYDRADSLISLSRMTFSHEMVRLFLAEQIYRAMTILRGEPYHHD